VIEKKQTRKFGSSTYGGKKRQEWIMYPLSGMKSRGWEIVFNSLYPAFDSSHKLENSVSKVWVYVINLQFPRYGFM